MFTGQTSTLLSVSRASNPGTHADEVLYRVFEAKEVFGSDDTLHPGVSYLLKTAKEFYVGGKLEALSRLEHYDFLDLRCKRPPVRSHALPLSLLTVAPG